MEQEKKESAMGFIVKAGLLLIMTLGLLAAVGQAAPIYVTTNGTDAAGGSWAAPTSLTNALVIATNGSEIWLAQGAYTNTATFTVRTNCALYGGFTNGMANLTDRNWTAYPTVLDGRAQNLRVVTVSGTNVTLDGLSISNSYGIAAGGIAKGVGGNLTLANCRLVNHVGRTSGMLGIGGYFTAGSVLMTNCVVASNTVSGSTAYAGQGFGIYSSGANLQLVDCLFSNNYGEANDTRSTRGIGLSFNNGNLIVTRTDFIGNIGGANNTDGGGSYGGGAAVYLGNSAVMSATFSNCVFRGNVALYCNSRPGYGGAMWVDLNGLATTCTVVNCTFKDNLNATPGNGGAINVTQGTLILKNSIFWTNAVASGCIGRDIYRTGGAIQINNCCLGGLDAAWIYGVTPDNMASVMTNNPLYASATDLHLQSPAGRWNPATGTFVTTDTAYSPCIDAGDPASPYSLEPVTNGNRVNLGAYGNTPQASKSPGAATPQVADRGVVLNYTRSTFSGELTNALTVIAEVGVCYGTNDIVADTTNGWQYVGRVYPPQQTGSIFSVASPYPYLLTNTTYYYRWYATNTYSGSWTAVSNFTTGPQYEPGRGVGGGSNVIHIKKNAAGNGSGQDWSNACTTIADGFSALSGSRTNIWLAGGDYAEGLEMTVRMNLAMIGGFAGTETNAAGRALTNVLGVATNYTSINGQGTHRCLMITAGDVWLDTLVFSNCTVGQSVNKAGAGALTMNNCRIVGNTAGVLGNGVGGYFSSGSVLMTNCVVASNTATESGLSGFGIYSSGANLQLADCLFSNNYGDAMNTRAARGVGLAFDNGTLVVTRTDFIGNFGGANHGGGGAALYLGTTANSATFSNCVFRANVAGYAAGYNPGYGGAIWVNLGGLVKTCTVVNCTFKDNLNDLGNGGAIYLSLGTLILKNSIFWTNAVRGGYTGKEIYRANGAVLISYSCLGGLAAPSLYGVAPANMSSVMTNNPLYASATDIHLQSPAGRWNPATRTFATTDTAYSPCIDVGDPASAYTNEPTPNGSRVNLGAYGNTPQASKSPTASPVVADRGVGFGFDYTKAAFSGELINASAVIASVGVCYGTSNVVADTTNGWQYVGWVYPPQQTGFIFSVTSPYLLTNTTYYYRWHATNAYGGSWTAASNFTAGSQYPPSWGVGGGPNVIHVKKDAAGDGDGRDWFNAFNSIANGYSAVSGTRTNIWITGGVYAEGGMLTLGTNLTMTGGFTGTETNAAGRALTNALGVVTNYTMLNGESAYKCLGVTAGNVWLDTLVFSNCNLAQTVNKAGTGILTMNNCRIVGNTAGANGVGGYFTAGTVLLTNCLVANNIVNNYGIFGYGIYSAGANLQLVDCLFSNNFGNAWIGRSGRGAGLAFDNGTLVVTRTDFISNGRPGHDGGGGAIYLGNSTNMSATFSNCVFRDNQSHNTNEFFTGAGSYGNVGYGGAMWANLNGLAKTVTVANCTFKDSLNDKGNGGAIYISAGTLVLKNSIFWTNIVRSGYSGSEIFANSAASIITNSYTCFSGTNVPFVVASNSAVIQWGNGVITNDPLYASATDVHLKSKAGRYDPASGTFVTTDTTNSPCIDAGDPSSAYANEPTPNGRRINMGAYGNTVQASKTYRPGGAIFTIR